MVARAFFECQVFFFRSVSSVCEKALHPPKSLDSRNLHTRFSSPGLNASNETYSYYLKVLRSFPAATYGRYWPSVIPAKSHDTVSQWGTSGYRSMPEHCLLRGRSEMRFNYSLLVWSSIALFLARVSTPAFS